MFEQVLDNFRRASESTIQFQQEMFRQWNRQWTQATGVSKTASAAYTDPGAWAEQFREFQKYWAKSVTDLLRKHKDTLDAQYESGVQAIEDAFKLADAKDPEHYRRLTEELWRHSFDCLKTVVQDQMREFQTMSETFSDAAAKGFKTSGKA
jgi:hypothetical protein